MIARCIAGLLLLGTAAMAKFTSIDAETLLSMQKRGVPVIDIRTPQEWNDRGIIPGAKLIMFFDAKGVAHPRSFLRKLQKLVPDKSHPFILYCAHSNRTKVVGKWLSQKLGYQNVYELNGGIEYGWRELGKPVTKAYRQTAATK
ncbi:rhodanese-like domain-containing protein [Nitratifractor sp.]